MHVHCILLIHDVLYACTCTYDAFAQNCLSLSLSLSSTGAPVGKHVAIFVDDLNMPKLDRYGSQPPIELLRQYQDFGGFYDREKLFWKQIKVRGERETKTQRESGGERGGRRTKTKLLLILFFFQDMTICAGCAPPGGGRNPVTPRFIRHFAMFCLPSPSEVSLKAIFKVMYMYSTCHVLILNVNVYCIKI